MASPVEIVRLHLRTASRLGRMLTRTSLFGLLLIGQPTASGDEPVADPQFVSQLLADLDAPTRRVRLRAESELVSLGAQVLPQIQQAQQSATGGMRPTLLRIQGKIEVRAARNLQEETLISFRTNSLASAAESLGRQSGTPVILDEAAREMTAEPELVVQNLPFWTALQLICQRAQLGWKWNEDRQIEIGPDLSPMAGAMAVSQHFLVGVNVSERKNTEPDSPQPALQRVQFQLDAEAILQPLFVQVDDADLALFAAELQFPPFSPEGRREINFTQQTARFAVDFQAPATAPADPMLTLLKGSLRCRCAAGTKDVSFDLSATNEQIQSAGRMTLRMLPPEISPEVIRVVLNVTYPADVRWESHQIGMLHTDAWLSTSNGRRIPFESLKVEREASQTHEIHYEFPTIHEPPQLLTMVYRSPLDVITLPVVFEIPLNAGTVR